VSSDGGSISIATAGGLEKFPNPGHVRPSGGGD
jgi:hypothetical protein